MKMIYLLLSVCLVTFKSSAQVGDAVCPLQPLCTYDLRNPIPAIPATAVKVLENVVYSKEGFLSLPPAQKKLFKNDPVYKNEEDQSCKPKTTDYCEFVDQAMIFDVYYPKFTGSINCSLPTIFIFHGGGYQECSGEDADVIKLICSTFVQRGFIAISCDYRAGRLVPPSGINPNTVKTVQFQLAVGKAAQDVLGAIASACKMEDDNKFGGLFHIDKSKIFVGGQSAGCGAVFSAIYLRNDAMQNAASPSIFPAIGGRRPDLYYAPPSYALPVINGVFANWAEFPFPNTVVDEPTAYQFFTTPNPGNPPTPPTKADIPPMIGFHGDDDETAIPYYRLENNPTEPPLPFG